MGKNSRVFAIGRWVDPDSPVSDPATHIFAGLLNEDGQGFEAGLAFGSDPGFDAYDERIAKKDVSHVLLLPISERSAFHFSGLISGLNELYETNHLPWYFSRGGQPYSGVHEHEEIFEDDPENPGGEKIVISPKVLDLEGRVNGLGYVHRRYMIDARGRKIEDQREIQMDGISRIPANCVQVLNFVLKRSGISLNRFNLDLSDVQSARAFENGLEPVFAEASSPPVRAKGLFLSKLNTSDGLEAWHAKIRSTDDVVDCSFAAVIERVQQASKGTERFMTAFAAMSPFECAVAPLPQYFEKALELSVLASSRVDVFLKPIPPAP